MYAIRSYYDDAEHRAEQADVGCVAADGGDQVQFPRQLQLQGAFVVIGVEVDGAEAEPPFHRHRHRDDTHQQQQADDPVVNRCAQPSYNFV